MLFKVLMPLRAFLFSDLEIPCSKSLIFTHYERKTIGWQVIFLLSGIKIVSFWHRFTHLKNPCAPPAGEQPF